MDYAIIESGDTKLLEVIKLSDWYDFEWSNFSTVKSKFDDEILWFEDIQEAVYFMKDKFPHEMINKKYFKEVSTCGNYYIDSKGEI